jgi:hypothetical protein
LPDAIRDSQQLVGRAAAALELLYADLQEVGQILDATSLSQFILSAAENNNLREEEDLLATVLAYH